MKWWRPILERRLGSLTGLILASNAGVDAAEGKVADALALLPAASLMFLWPRIMNNAFEIGWSACARGYDNALKGEVSEQSRHLLWMANHLSRRNYADHVEWVRQEVDRDG